MKIVILFPLVFLSLLFQARAEILGVEQFDYPDGSLANQTGGTFWDWQNRNIPAPGPRHTGTNSDWDDITGAPLVTNGRLITNNSSARREYNGPGEGLPIETDEGLGAINNFSNGTISFQEHRVYCRVTFTTGATLPASISLTSVDHGTDRVTFGVSLNVPGAFSIQDLATSAGSNGGTATANTTCTVVAKLDYLTGMASLYVNPDLNAAEPAPLIIRPFSTAFWSTALRLTSGSGTAVAWDDLVIASTWEELGTIVTTATDEDNGSLVSTAGGGSGVSLREAVKYSPAGSLITFAPALNGQTCTLSFGEMVIDKPLTLDGSALANGVTIDTNHTSRHFAINGTTASLTLKSLALSNGNGVGNASNIGGAILLFTGNLFLQRCTLSGNSAGNAGAIWLQGSGTSRLEECTLTGNRATASPGTGGIAVPEGTCTLSRCTISGNTGSGNGGGLFLQSPASVSLSNCLIAGNSDSLFNDLSMNSGILTASGNNLIGSNATVSTTFPTGPLVGTQAAPLDPKLSPLGYFGGPTQTMHPLIGSPAIDAGGPVNPGGTDQRGFPRFVDGDGLGGTQLDIGAVEAGPLVGPVPAGDPATGPGLRSVITFATAFGTPGVRFAFNPAAPPGTITLHGEEISIAAIPGLFIDASNIPGGVTISGNNASRVFNIAAGATVAMHSLKIVNGQAGGGEGGGVYNSGILTMIQATISHNRGRIGGGLYNNNSGVMELNQCTLSGNAANGGFNGGGLQNRGSLRVNQSTITGNSAYNGGAIDNEFGGSWFVEQSTIAANSASNSGGGIYTFLGTNTLKNSIVAANTSPSDPNTSGTFTTVGTNLIASSPLLAPLSDYGGPTFTMLPLPGSPAINAGTTSNSRTTDQRGLPMNGTPDLGAVEVQAALSGFVDTDGDGMDDRLEPLYGFVVGVQDGNLDADGDGSKNKDELGNLTGPRDPASLLKMVSISRSGSNMTFTWTSFPGLNYTAQYGPAPGNFSGQTFVGTASGMTTTQTLGPLTGSSVFLRIRRD